MQGNGQVVVYTLLSVVLLLIIAYIVWKATKNKRAKRKAEKLENKKNAETLALYYDFIITYKHIIDFTKQELNKFVEKETLYKMGQIKEGARRLLLKLINRDDFAFFFKDDEKYSLFVENAELLTITQPNLWEKKINNVLEFFENQYNSIPEEKRNNNLEKITLESIERQFYEEK
ncbi:MHJ_0274 family protein [Mycoplasmopsis arginini]|uniref:DUF4760 domain-containing protein n=1 Tax=Mycoplasmopsis arginini TaxID=2094 RepID=A0ABZ2AMS8_MYCAR|nr:hypothetical protein [Mycoplasmopsis arginini]ENY70039.1 Hypothetical protein, predicted transmembrane protein [Mycoplasmopsis arginini 7264]MDI3348396.1 hypothetical protein [Mycoplasmopsis arginini]MDI3349083.1 hypothetical protein [Mycoplasmopsis arginini]MDI3351529.1 hypothetical protein [Mycoplasmopsis arginini]MDI3351969.1 hypothetical protein [Mycoplasmopsis arginini]